MYATTELVRKAPTTLSTNGILKTGIVGFLCVFRSDQGQCAVDNAAGGYGRVASVRPRRSSRRSDSTCNRIELGTTKTVVMADARSGTGREQPEWQKRSDRDVFVVH